MNDVHDLLRAAVENDDVRAEDHSAIHRRQPGQPAFQVVRKRLDAFLQTWRQGSIALQMLLQSGRQIAVTLGESRRKIGAVAVIVIANHIAIMGGEDDLDTGPSILVLAVFPMALAL